MMARKILFVGGAKNFLQQAVINKLCRQDFLVDSAPDDINEIAARGKDAGVVLYYPTGSREHMETITVFLLDLCKDVGKKLCVLGDPYDVAFIEHIDEGKRIFRSYKRPVDMNRLLRDMRSICGSREEKGEEKTILVVDDDPDFLKIMRSWLKNDYHVDTVRSGSEALLYAALHEPDLILLDYEMPGANGSEVLESLRSNVMMMRIPVIFLTGMDEKENVLRILKQRPDGYLLKTQCKEDLLDALERFFVADENRR